MTSECPSDHSPNVKKKERDDGSVLDDCQISGLLFFPMEGRIRPNPISPSHLVSRLGVVGDKYVSVTSVQLSRCHYQMSTTSGESCLLGPVFENGLLPYLSDPNRPIILQCDTTWLLRQADLFVSVIYDGQHRQETCGADDPRLTRGRWISLSGLHRYFGADRPGIPRWRKSDLPRPARAPVLFSLSDDTCSS